MRRETKPRFSYPAEKSVGHQLRAANRAFQRDLQERIQPFGITNGMWWFLRPLWEEDGLSQRELSEKAGTTEPTTVTAVHAMEKRGLVVRVRDRRDRRKSNIFLTRSARALRERILPCAREVNQAAAQGIPAAEIKAFMRTLAKMRANLAAAGARRAERKGKP
ncbi:MAG TPA: MarR family winged helix-turn-helix transcriptional regulator [Alphaproteobacteria bacterium]|nr:MarR family winged helix-turn-helix transcriptional regulator [Alphaproteobacteria bacterium]